MVQCKIALMGSDKAVPMCLNNGTTLAQMLAAADATSTNKIFASTVRTYKRNGVVLDMSSVINDGDIVIGFENIKGAMPIASVSRISGRTVENVIVPEGVTFQQAIDLASQVAAKNGISFSADVSKNVIRFAGREVSPSEVIPAGSSDNIIISIFENLKGAMAMLRKLRRFVFAR